MSIKRKTRCDVCWGSHGCDKRYPHKNHRCDCELVVTRDGVDVRDPSFRWELYLA